MYKYQEVQEYCANKYGKETTTGKKDIGDFYMDSNHPVNVKSNNLDKKNYSPNIISAKRLLKWLENPENKFSLIFIDYRINNGSLEIIKESELIPIEKISWSCLSIEAQGWGIIQKIGELKIEESQSRIIFLKGLQNAYFKYKIKEQNKSSKMEELIASIIRIYE